MALHGLGRVDSCSFFFFFFSSLFHSFFVSLHFFFGAPLSPLFSPSNPSAAPSSSRRPPCFGWRARTNGLAAQVQRQLAGHQTPTSKRRRTDDAGQGQLAHAGLPLAGCRAHIAAVWWAPATRCELSCTCGLWPVGCWLLLPRFAQPGQPRSMNDFMNSSMFRWIGYRGGDVGAHAYSKYTCTDAGRQASRQAGRVSVTQRDQS